MPIFELYSQRKRRLERGDLPEVYQYDKLPTALRTQLAQIFSEAIGGYYVSSGYGGQASPNNNETWKEICRLLRREKGADRLGPGGENRRDEVLNYLRSNDADDALDVVHACCVAIEKIVPTLNQYSLKTYGIRQAPDAALHEVNYRFRQAGVGLQYESGQIVRIDSQFLHSEVVKPALAVLRDPRFKGAEEEFLEAHKQYRSGNPKDAVTGANRAFESAMKVVCDIKGWTYDKSARASDLVKLLRRNGLFPDYLDNAFDQLIATLSSGLPVVRNNDGGHGQGGVPRETPGYVAAYALHLAATNIVFLAEIVLSAEA
jgi:hypothetical protein